MHHESADPQALIEYLESEIDRGALIGSMIVAAGKHLDPATQGIAVEVARSAHMP